ncbi:hypothetical protein V6N13_065377 [Hibiscus sabdariffa]
MAKPIMDWKKLLSGAEEQSLDFYPPIIQEGSPVVQPQANVFYDGIADWKLSLVGQFIGSAPNFSAMKKITELLWGKSSTMKTGRDRLDTRKDIVGSANKFAVLSDGDVPIPEGRKPRATSQETRIRQHNVHEIMSFYSADWNYLCNADLSVNGRILVMWKKEPSFQVLHVNGQSVTITGSFYGTPMAITTIYGSNDGISRKSLWQQLQHTASM